MPFSFLKNRNQNKTRDIRFEAEELGIFSSLAKSIYKKPIIVTFVQVIFNASIVTFVALHAGHYAGFGKMAPTTTFIYFSIYTAVAGAITLAVTIISSIITQRRQDTFTLNSSLILDRLPDLIIGVRDLISENYMPELRQSYAASILLRNSHANPDAIYLAVLNITDQNTRLAKIAADAEIYRRSGLRQIIDDISNEVWPEVEQAAEKLSLLSQELADRLKSRMRGRAPTLKEGLKRTEGFLERTMHAIETGDSSFMTLMDAKEILILTFELLNGRKLKHLTFRFKGSFALGRAVSELEEARIEHRIARGKYQSRIKAIIEHLHQSGNTTAREILLNMHATQKNQEISLSIDQLCERIRPYLQIKNIHTEDKDEAIRLTRHLQSIVTLHKRVHAAQKDVMNKAKRLKKALTHWEKKSSATPFFTGLVVLPFQRRGLEIVEKEIALSDKQKAILIRDLSQELEPYITRKRSRRILRVEDGEEVALHPEVIKNLAMDILILLDKHIACGDPSIQYTLNNSNSANLGSLDIGLSLKGKAQYALNVISEVEDNIGNAANQLAKVLVFRYGEQLTDESRNFLVENYQASREFLESLDQMSPPQDYLIQEKTEEIFPEWPKLENRWKDLLHQAEHSLFRKSKGKKSPQSVHPV